MTKEIPQIKFNPEDTENVGFEIVPIEKIALYKEQINHDAELPHQLKFYNFIYFTEGTGKHFIDFKWYTIKQNTLVYLSKDQVHAFDFSTNLKGFCIVFTEDYFLKCFSNFSSHIVFRLFNPQLFSPILKIPKDTDFDMYFNLLQKEHSNSNVLNQKTIVESLFIILISKAEQLKQLQTQNIKDSSKIIIFQKFISLIEKELYKTRSADY